MIILIIDYLLYQFIFWCVKYGENSEKCPPHFPRARNDMFKMLVSPTQWFKPTNYPVYCNLRQEKAANPHI